MQTLVTPAVHGSPEFGAPQSTKMLTPPVPSGPTKTVTPNLAGFVPGGWECQCGAENTRLQAVVLTGGKLERRRHLELHRSRFRWSSLAAHAAHGDVALPERLQLRNKLLQELVGGRETEIPGQRHRRHHVSDMPCPRRFCLKLSEGEAGRSGGRGWGAPTMTLRPGFSTWFGSLPRVRAIVSDPKS